MSIVTCTLDSTRKIINLQKTNSQTNEKSQWCHIFKFFLILFYFCLVGHAVSGRLEGSVVATIEKNRWLHTVYSLQATANQWLAWVWNVAATQVGPLGWLSSNTTRFEASHCIDRFAPSLISSLDRFSRVSTRVYFLGDQKMINPKIAFLGWERFFILSPKNSSNQLILPYHLS
jgi:hypothetical protein